MLYWHRSDRGDALATLRSMCNEKKSKLGWNDVCSFSFKCERCKQCKILSTRWHVRRETSVTVSSLSRETMTQRSSSHLVKRMTITCWQENNNLFHTQVVHSRSAHIQLICSSSVQVRPDDLSYTCRTIDRATNCERNSGQETTWMLYEYNHRINDWWLADVLRRNALLNSISRFNVKGRQWRDLRFGRWFALKLLL